MALHRLTSITIGVPDVARTAAYYEEFGLTPTGEGRYATVDGGEQLQLVPSPRRRLFELGIGVDDPDDLGRVAGSLARLGVSVERAPAALTAVDPGTGVRVAVRVAERIRQASTPPLLANAPGPVFRIIYIFTLSRGGMATRISCRCWPERACSRKDCGGSTTN